MTTIRVTWQRRMAIGPNAREEVRSMTQVFGSAKKAAEFAADLLFMRGEPSINGWSDSFYRVSRDKPRVQWQSNTQDEWLTVERMGA